MSFLGGGGSGTTVQTITPYAPAQPALNQILANAGYLYQQGVSPYVAPSQQTLTGLGIQESLGTAAAQQLAGTLAGQYTNPFLSPLIQRAGQEAYGTVAQQFSGAGRTPTSPLAQQQVADIVAQRALPLCVPRIWTRKSKTIRYCSKNSKFIYNWSAIRTITKRVSTSTI